MKKIEKGKLERKTTLTIKDLEIKNMSKTCLVGFEASKKIDFFKILKKDYKNISGNFGNEFSTSYLDLTANSNSLFLQGKTIKDNITMGSTYIFTRYKEIINLIGFDTSKYPGKNAYEVTESGLNLEISDRYLMLISRWLYQQRDLYIIKGFYALDFLVGNSDVKLNLFKKIIFFYLKNKTVIYDSNDLKAISLSDYVLVFSDSRLVEQGTIEQIKEKKTTILDEICNGSKSLKTLGGVVDLASEMKRD